MCKCKSSCLLQLKRAGSLLLHHTWLGLQGLWFLFVLLLYQLLVFVAVLSVSIGLSVACSGFYALCWGGRLGSDTEAILTLMITFMLGECALMVQQDVKMGAWIRDKARSHTILVGKIPPIIYCWLFLLAFSQLFVQYRNAHPSTYLMSGKVHVTATGEVNELADRHSQGQLDKIVTSIFLLSLCYVAYVVARFSDWIRFRAGLPIDDRMKATASFCTFIFYIWVQAILLYIYGIPIFIAAALCKFSYISPPTTFMLVNFGAFVVGFNVTQIESSKPFPTVALLPPDYRFESHMCARVNLLEYVLLPLIAIGYYGPRSLFLGLPPEDRFLLYTIFVGLATLQISKVIFNVRYLEAIRRLRLRRQRGEAELAALEAGGAPADVGIEIIAEPEGRPDPPPQYPRSRQPGDLTQAPAQMNIHQPAADAPTTVVVELNHNEEQPHVIINRCSGPAGQSSSAERSDDIVSIEFEGVTYNVFKV